MCFYFILYDAHQVIYDAIFNNVWGFELNVIEYQKYIMGRFNIYVKR